MINTIIRLRRDNDYNYAKVKDTFIPANGEICLVDTARDGLRAVCGDGKTPFGQLEYLGGVIVLGYYSENEFYSNAQLTQKILGSTLKIYIDLSSNAIYYFDGQEYKSFQIPDATSSTKGIMKLYDTLGDNVDGTMTQKAITDELDDKVELSLKADEELLIFTVEE